MIKLELGLFYEMKIRYNFKNKHFKNWNLNEQILDLFVSKKRA
jgi:hypothetical protein